MLNPNTVSDVIYFSSINPELFAADTANIRRTLLDKGVNFEGRTLPVSLKPNLIDAGEAHDLAADLALVRQALNKLVDGLRRELSAGRVGRLSAFFADYQQWFSIIASEARRLDPIMLMRFDTVRKAHGSFLAVEPNACCPGGVIHAARVRGAWLQTALGQRYASTFEIEESAVDDEYGFVQFVLSLAKQYPAKNVAVCNYNGVYTFELEALAEAGNVVRQNFDPGAGQIVFCDIRELSVRAGLTYAREIPVGVVYNKIDATMIRDGDPEIAGWQESCRSRSCDFLNSLGAIYLAESKSAFAALMDETIQNLINLDVTEVAAIKRRVPVTTSIPMLEQRGLSGNAVTNRHDYVLKPNYESRGVGVLVGRHTTEAIWIQALKAYGISGGVVQDAIDIETRLVREVSTATGDLVNQVEFFGADVFFFGADFAGIVGRSHTDPIINVGNGGREIPTLVISGYLATALDLENSHPEPT
jgi:uncharacterized circularly permuted ATP-grasp superfamily protein